MSKQEELLICECHSTDHQLIFLYDDDPAWDRVYVHVHLSPERGFWKRLWFGLKYAFGYRSKYGDFDEMVLNPDDAVKIQRVATHLKKIKARESNS
jgi:hypothetical protein